MCGIAGIIDLDQQGHRDIVHSLEVMNHLQKHRGPDGEGVWEHPKKNLGLSHVRLSIIDLETGQQPMKSPNGNVVSYNGEIYNYIELRKELGEEEFQTTSDTEVLLNAYERWGVDCLAKFRGMFSFALWDEQKQRLFCARDRFGIKPFYYTVVEKTLYLASEIKTLLPFLPVIETDESGLKDYLAFQFTLGEKTLFQGVKQLLPGHFLLVQNGELKIKKYWEVYYDLDWYHTEKYFVEKVRALLEESISLHLRSDVPVGAYVSGGRDSGISAAMATKYTEAPFYAFTGKFTYGPEYDESQYARDLAEMYQMILLEIDISSQNFIDNIQKVIYHLDVPVAGPGSFPQYQVSQLASQHRKVVLGGQGGDEIFGGYARYLIAYFEQCIKGGIEGSLQNGNFIVTYESIIPNLVTLQQYKPLLKQFWSKGLFDSLEKRYFSLVDRAPTLKEEIRWQELGSYSPEDTFREIFLGNNVQHESYFDLMTHFDFKTLLPALLQVEDRMSMAHGLESRVPFLDHPLVELVATIPADIKFKDGTLKRLLIKSFDHILPDSIVNRKDKMGFPVPLNEWMQGELREFVCDIFNTQSARQRKYFNSDVILSRLNQEGKFSRKIWGLLSLELWMQEFHDQADKYHQLLKENV
ncbi:asparagine synthase (glutamine-hydrolyzing) [Deltaproteobacteria bacterium TL4]